MTFSNNLRVGGEQDVSYSDVRPQWPRATEDGEQINIDPPQEEVEPADPNLPPIPAGRPAGKLYGKSLIDDLEARKLHMRSKQRTFTGDQRPSMMARASASSTSLLDPSSIRNRPNPNRSSSYSTQGPERRHSTMKPLLDLGDDQLHSSAPMPAHTKSVFGVDTLWEREMGKLREMEAAEKIEAERQALLEAQNPSPGNNKGKKKGKGVASPPMVTPLMASPSQEEIPAQRLSALPPTLPAINTIRGPPPVVDDDDSDSDSGDEAPRAQSAPGAKWADESDDEKPQVLRTTGVGPRQRVVRKQTEDDSDEDVPLSRVIIKSPRPRQDESDSDEEKPLSMLMPKALIHGNDEDDDAPLGLRVSTAFKGAPTGGDDDDKPLAFHPEQQRRTQYQMLAQQQFEQQQQQMMMQAQLQNSMFFGNPSNMSGFFPPPMSMAGPMMPGMGPIPMPLPSPPPIQDPSKAAWLDQWRREVVPGEGSADSRR